jgi:hypothetical protein
VRGESPAEQDLDLRPVTFLASRGQTLLGLAATEAQHQIGGFEGHHGWLIERQFASKGLTVGLRRRIYLTQET